MENSRASPSAANRTVLQSMRRIASSSATREIARSAGMTPRLGKRKRWPIRWMAKPCSSRTISLSILRVTWFSLALVIRGRNRPVTCAASNPMATCAGSLQASIFPTAWPFRPMAGTSSSPRPGGSGFGADAGTPSVPFGLRPARGLVSAERSARMAWPSPRTVVCMWRSTAVAR